MDHVLLLNLPKYGVGGKGLLSLCPPDPSVLIVSLFGAGRSKDC